MFYINPLETLHASRDDMNAFNEAKQAHALKELEHQFTYMLLQEMRKSVDVDGPISRSQAQREYDDMLDDALSEAWASSGQIGIRAQIEAQMRGEDARHDACLMGLVVPLTPPSDAPPTASVRKSSSMPAMPIYKVS